MSKFLVFRRFESSEEASAVRKILTKNNIPSVLSEEIALLDSTLLGQNFDLPFRVKIPAEHFVQAEKVLRQSTDINAIEVEKDYYLLAFSNEELMEIIEKKDEWGSYDYALALQLLEQRGHKLSSEDIERLNKKRMETLAIPENGMNIWMLVGYLSAFIGGAMGIFIGAFLMKAKKTLPDGSRVFAYNSDSRTHGKYIIILGIVAIPLWVAYAIIFNGSIPGVSSLFGLFGLFPRFQVYHPLNILILICCTGSKK